MAAEPSPAEMWRRMDDIKEAMLTGLASVNERLDRMPTSELLTVHLNAWEQQLSGVRHEVRRVEIATFTEIKRVEDESDKGRKVLHDKIESQQAQTTVSRRWSIMAVIAGAGAVVAFVSLFVQYGGSGSA